MCHGPVAVEGLSTLDATKSSHPWHSLEFRPCDDGGRSGHYEVREHRLDLVDVDLFGELLLNRRCIPRNLDLQLGVQVEGPGGFDGDVRDREWTGKLSNLSAAESVPSSIRVTGWSM